MTLPEGTAEHRAAAGQRAGARIAIVIVSDKRTLATDESGPLARTLLTAAGHTIADFALLPNERAVFMSPPLQWTYSSVGRAADS